MAPEQLTRQQRRSGDFVIEFRSSAKSCSYQRMSPYMSNQIKGYLKTPLNAFWVKNPANGAFLLFDFETMQQFNVSTGYRRTLRCINYKNNPATSGKRKRRDAQSVNSIDLTNSDCVPIDAVQSAATGSTNAAASLAQPSSSHVINQNDVAKKNTDLLAICCSAYKAPVFCGQAARKKLAQIRLLQLSRCKFVQDTRCLPKERRLFNPDPIPEDDPNFPINQVRHLDRGGISVHEISPSGTWNRNRQYFDLLYEEEKKLYAAHATSDGPAKIKHFAWHGAPADCIRGILEYGFLVGPTPRVGNRYGHGVYLSTEKYGRYSMNATYSQPDTSGFQFMLLCEVLPGTVEASVSQQIRPSSVNVHSGVDQLPGASMHVFYTFDMNVRISPKYLVIIHPGVTDAVMNLVPNEMRVPTTITVSEANEPVVIDCT